MPILLSNQGPISSTYQGLQGRPVRHQRHSEATPTQHVAILHPCTLSCKNPQVFFFKNSGKNTKPCCFTVFLLAYTIVVIPKRKSSLANSGVKWGERDSLVNQPTWSSEFTNETKNQNSPTAIIDRFFLHPNTSWEGIWTLKTYLKHLLKEVFGCLGIIVWPNAPWDWNIYPIWVWIHLITY